MRRITLNFEVAARQKKNGTFPIYLRITENSIHFKYVLDVYVLNRKNFNAQAKKESWISSKEPYAKTFNEKLSTILETTHKIIIKLELRGELSAANLIKQIKGGNDCDSFLAYLRKKQQEFMDKRMYSYSESFLYLEQKLNEYTNNRDILFRDVTYSFIQGFVLFLQKQYTKKGYLKESTIHSIVSRFKTIYKCAVLEDYISGNQSNPFDRIKIKKNKPMKIALSRDELDKINSLDLEENSSLWHVRNYFMFAMYMAGMRISDVMNLKWENIESNRLVYTMQKTKLHCSLAIYNKAQEILDLYKKENCVSSDYIFPIMTVYENKRKKTDLTLKELSNRRKARTTNINHHLKILVKKAGIEKNVSFHISRHTFATIASRTEIGVYNISQLLGHSNISITQTYLNDINETVQDKALQRVFL